VDTNSNAPTSQTTLVWEYSDHRKLARERYTPRVAQHLTEAWQHISKR